MKKILFSFALCAGLAFGIPASHSQSVADTVDIPYGCFETWNHYNADTLSLGFFSLPINYDYSLPAGWNVPMYHISETLSYAGFSLPIDATIPLANVYIDSVNAPQGHAGVVAESFLLSDIIDPTIYSLASSMLDSSLTNTVIPSIVATGQINIDNILPLMDVIYGNTDDLSWMMDMLDTIDLNDYLSGGFPLNGMDPAKLIGYYKYIYPAGSVRDNAAVVALGTRYDTVSHKRKLVGAGSKNLFQLYDTVLYEPFEMDYSSLSSYFPAGYDFYDADSMVVLLISSANAKARLDGSRLFIDSLRLVSRPTPCGRIENFRVASHTAYSLNLEWNNTAAPDSWELEYGPAGFVQGRGTLQTENDSAVCLIGLTPDSDYDFFVRGLCGDTANTEWVFLSVHTDAIPTEGISETAGVNISVSPNPAQGMVVLEYSEMNISRMRLYSIDGRQIDETDNVFSGMRINLPQKGLYLLAFDTPQGTIYQKVTSLK